MVSLYRKAADAGRAGGMDGFGVCEEPGEGLERDARDAGSLYRKAADAGHAGGKVNLSGSYRRGEGVQRSAGEAALP